MLSIAHFFEFHPTVVAAHAKMDIPSSLRRDEQRMHKEQSRQFSPSQRRTNSPEQKYSQKVNDSFLKWNPTNYFISLKKVRDMVKLQWVSFLLKLQFVWILLINSIWFQLSFMKLRNWNTMIIKISKSEFHPLLTIRSIYSRLLKTTTAFSGFLVRGCNSKAVNEEESMQQVFPHLQPHHPLDFWTLEGTQKTQWFWL